MCTFHVCVVDGVFEELAREGKADSNVQASAPRVVFPPASAIDETAAAQVQATWRGRTLDVANGPSTQPSPIPPTHKLLNAQSTVCGRC